MTLAHSAAAITLATTDLMPPHWLHGAWGHDFAIYNPAIVRYRDRLLMAYRVDLGRGPTMQRKIGLCELNPALQIITMRVPTVLRLPPPFRPRWITKTPVLCPENELPRQRKQRINPCADGIVYPCGAIPWSTDRWLVSYGVHDEHCCLQYIDLGQAVKVSGA